MKNILIPTDFSENSWNAIEYALSFFKNTGCNFYFLHVSPYESISNGVSQRSFEPQIATNVTEQFQLLLKRVDTLPLNPKHSFFTVQEHIFFVDSIRRQITDKNIDFMVMGTKGASGLKGRTTGSNTGDVITKVKCPVLVIPEKAIYSRPKAIAFPTDYNIYYKSRVMDTLMEVLTLSKASLKVLHIVKREEELTNLQKRNKDFLQDYLGDKVAHSFHSLSNPDIEAAVQFFVESRDIDMITMIGKNLNFFQRILFHPTIEKISYHTEVPFLVLHE